MVYIVSWGKKGKERKKVTEKGCVCDCVWAFERVKRNGSISAPPPILFTVCVCVCLKGVGLERFCVWFCRSPVPNGHY